MTAQVNRRMHFSDSDKDSQKGAAFIEFLIVLFFLIPLLYGVIEVGMGSYERSLILQATREGARAASRIDPFTYNLTDPAVYRTAISQQAMAVVREYLLAARVDPATFNIGVRGVQLVAGRDIWGIEVTVQFPRVYWWSSGLNNCARSVFLVEGQLASMDQLLSGAPC